MATTTHPQGIALEDLLIYDPTPDRMPATVEIVIPVFNEEAALDRSVRRLMAYIEDRFPIDVVVTVADNASTDRTWAIACRLADELDRLRAARLERKGRGRALRNVWARSSATVVAYMDVDLSTGLDALLPLVAPLLTGHSDLAIGTRLAPASRVARGPKRELISRGYNLLLRTALGAGFTDAQCGFKAGRSDALAALLPMIEDQGWFFDTELLVLAEHNGLRIHEVPVDWVDDPDSRVDVVSTAAADLRGVARLATSFVRGGGTLADPLVRRQSIGRRSLGEQVVRFASIGFVSTLVFAGLFLLGAPQIGVVWADVVALTVCSIANTAANRRLTFALGGRSERRRHTARALVAAVVPLGLNLGALSLAAGAGIGAVWAMLAVLVCVNAGAGVLRFVLLDRWVFGDRGRR